MLPHLLPKPRLLALAAIVLFVVVAAGLPFLGGAFLPDFQEPAVTVDTKDSTQTTRRRSQMREGHPRHPVLHYLFELGVSLKFLNGLLEVVGGIFLLFSTPESLSKLAAKLLTSELLEDPNDLVANTLLHAAQRLSANAQIFASVYLLLHGIVKVGLVIALWKKKLWAYPLAGIVLALFTVYQVYLFSLSGSLLQVFLTIVDVVILLLLWSEYKRVAQRQRK